MTDNEETIISGILIKLVSHVWIDPDKVEHRFMMDEPKQDGNMPLFLTDKTNNKSVETTYTINVEDGVVFITYLNIKYKLISIADELKLENENGRIINMPQSD